MSRHAMFLVLPHEEMIDDSTQGQIQSASDVLLSKHQPSWKKRSKPTRAATSSTIHHRSEWSVALVSVCHMARRVDSTEISEQRRAGGSSLPHTGTRAQTSNLLQEMKLDSFIQFDWLESVIHTPPRHKDLERRSNQPLKSARWRQKASAVEGKSD